MKSGNKTALPRDLKTLRWLYVLLLIMMGFAGFEQMPIFKRYYISDIPALGWSSDFYFTHAIHSREKARMPRVVHGDE
jgi:hypothetical protein